MPDPQPASETWTIHNGVRVLIVDWTRAPFEEEMASLDRLQGILDAEPGKVLLCADVTECGWGLPLLDSIRKFMIRNKSRVGRFVVVGMPKAYMSAVGLIRTLVDVPVPLFDTRDQALRALTAPRRRK